MEMIKRWGKKAYQWCVKYPVATILTLLVAVVGIIAVVFNDRINLGGLIGKLWGNDVVKDPVATANTVPPDRVDKNGEPIPIGEADEHGNTQWKVKKLKTSNNPFRDKTKVTINTDEGDVVVKLPEGLQDKDVDKVIEVKPGEFVVVNVKDSSGVSVGDLLDDLPE